MIPIPPGFFSYVTPIGLLLFILASLFWFLMTGRLRTNRAVQEIREDRDVRVAEARQDAADWKEAFRVSEEARHNQDQISKEALELSRISEDNVRSLRIALEMDRREKGIV